MAGALTGKLDWVSSSDRSAILRGLLAFDATRLGWRTAARTVAGLLLPLLAAKLLMMPALVWVAMAAYLLAIGNATEHGDQLEIVRLAIGTILGALALATGVVAGIGFVPAVIGMMFWGAVAGVLGTYGNAFAAMGLPVAWAYIELGLPARDHTLAHAAAVGGWFALGGALAICLTLLPGFGWLKVPRLTGLSGALMALGSCLDSQSVIGRHALRFALLASAAVALSRLLSHPFGYWIPLTVTVVLKPTPDATFGRMIHRILGTGLGVVAGSALTPYLANPVAQLAVIAVAFFWMMAVLPFNYGMAIFFLSVGLIPFEHWLIPGVASDLGLWRLEATCLGAALAVIGGHLMSRCPPLISWHRTGVAATLMRQRIILGDDPSSRLAVGASTGCAAKRRSGHSRSCPQKRPASLSGLAVPAVMRR